MFTIIYRISKDLDLRLNFGSLHIEFIFFSMDTKNFSAFRVTFVIQILTSSSIQALRSQDELRFNWTEAVYKGFITELVSPWRNNSNNSS